MAGELERAGWPGRKDGGAGAQGGWTGRTGELGRAGWPGGKDGGTEAGRGPGRNDGGRVGWCEGLSWHDREMWEGTDVVPRLRPETSHSRARREPPQLIRQQCGQAAGILPLPVGEGRGEGTLLRGALAPPREHATRPRFPTHDAETGYGPLPEDFAVGVRFLPEHTSLSCPDAPCPLTPTLSRKGRGGSPGRQTGEGPLLPREEGTSPATGSPVLPATRRCRKDRGRARWSQGAVLPAVPPCPSRSDPSVMPRSGPSVMPRSGPSVMPPGPSVIPAGC